jgi:hypothetical protein
MNTVAPGSRPVAIVVAHPGHELIVHHWMEEHRPTYCCLTDGSGGAATSRLSSTARLLDSVGALEGPIFGRYSDRHVYQLLLEKRVDVFVSLTKELAAALEGVDCVVGDAIEGFNPAHDVCRLIIDGAVLLLRRRMGREVRNYDFLLEGRHEPSRPGSIIVRLDEAALDRKLAAANAYTEMRAEVQAALSRHGRQAFAVECLRPVATDLGASRFEQDRPAYEHYGERRVTEGRYTEIIRYRDHVRPVARAIEGAVGLICGRSTASQR